jgi:hypothetical protein
MKRFYSVALAIVAAMAVFNAPAQAGLCVPQTNFSCTSLQNNLNAWGESIDVLTQQQEGLVWGSSVSTNTTMTIQFQLAGNPNHDEFGIVGLSSTGPSGFFPVFPSANFGTGWFAVASFRPGNVLKVNIFDPSATLVGSATYSGVDRTRFAYYLKNSNGTFYSHVGYNLDGKIHSLVYAGTGANTGCWWMAWEDSLNPDASADYNDGLMFLESLNPTPVSRTTWGTVKSRFR